MPLRRRFNESYDELGSNFSTKTLRYSRERASNPTELVFAALAFVFIRAAQEPLQRALLASAAPLLEPRRGGALDLFRRPGLPRTEVADAAGKQHGKRLGERHRIGLVTGLGNALDAAQVHHQPDRALAEQAARPGIIEEGTLPDPGLGVVHDRKIAAP